MGANAKHIVETKTGKKGVVYVNKPLLNGKVCVYIIDENQNEIENKFLLCDPKTLKQIGFID